MGRPRKKDDSLDARLERFRQSRERMTYWIEQHANARTLRGKYESRRQLSLAVQEHSENLVAVLDAKEKEGSG